MTNRNLVVSIPTPAKNFTWILICAVCFFFYVYIFSLVICILIPSLDTYSVKMGFASTEIRTFGNVITPFISVLANNPNWLFVTILLRIFIELGVVVSITLDGINASTFALSVLASSEIWIVLTQWKIKKKIPYYTENSQQIPTKISWWLHLKP